MLGNPPQSGRVLHVRNPLGSPTHPPFVQPLSSVKAENRHWQLKRNWKSLQPNGFEPATSATPALPPTPNPAFPSVFRCVLLLRGCCCCREAGGNRKRKKERVGRRQSQGRERERENTTDARRFPKTEEGKRKKKFFEHETLWFHPGDCASSPTWFPSLAVRCFCLTDYRFLARYSMFFSKVTRRKENGEGVVTCGARAVYLRNKRRLRLQNLGCSSFLFAVLFVEGVCALCNRLWFSWRFDFWYPFWKQDLAFDVGVVCATSSGMIKVISSQAIRVCVRVRHFFGCMKLPR